MRRLHHPAADIQRRRHDAVSAEPVERECLVREHARVETSLGTVRMKLAWREGKLVNAVPEFDDCAKLAAANNLPVKEVQALAVKAWGQPS